MTNPNRYLVDLRKAPLLIALDAAKRQARAAARHVRWFVITVRHFVAGAIRLLRVPIIGDTEWCAYPPRSHRTEWHANSMALSSGGYYVAAGTIRYSATEPSVPVSAIGERGTQQAAAYTDTPRSRWERAALPQNKVTTRKFGTPSDFYGSSMRKAAESAGL